MTPYDHAGAVIVFEGSHQVQTRFELPIVRFDSIVRVLLSVVERSRDQLIHYGERHPGPIGDHLDRFTMSACAIVKNRRAASISRRVETEMSMIWPCWSIAR